MLKRIMKFIAAVMIFLLRTAVLPDIPGREGTRHFSGLTTNG